MDDVFKLAMHRVPAVGRAGIKLFLNGPESFTPDDRYHLGAAPEVKNFYVAAGFNSIGIQSSGGAGKVLAEWIVNGHAPMDLWDVDIRRNMPFQNNRSYLENRVGETLGLLYDMHWPYRQYETSRNVRMSPLHARLEGQGACFGEMVGWERANWYTTNKTKPSYVYSYGRQNWFQYARAEHLAVRENVGLFDQSSFSKFLLQGKDALPLLNQICGNEINVADGKVVYTQVLNERGGIEGDITVTRLDREQFLLVDSAAHQTKLASYVRSFIDGDSRAYLTDVTSAYAVVSIMGPRSRALLEQLTDTDLSNEHFPFGTAQTIALASAQVLALRTTYVGELGWELHVPTEFAVGVYDALIKEGRGVHLKHCGYHALDSLRIEKGYRHWGHDIGDTDTPFEAGLGYAVRLAKPSFLGKEILERQKTQGVHRRLLQFVLNDPAPLLYHNEPILRNGSIVGIVTSGAYGHTVGAAVGLGYVPIQPLAKARSLLDADYQIDVAGTLVSATPYLRSVYDPEGMRVAG